ncbi:hypothetical protein Bacsa_3246 [Phocaeicola salanitronis DSM 18170]|uniref:Uncharacterized protein n=1 Tax=Phocaeicola salanitronis (strain DSM 18170 / JCM 13657 / CCUG 60908 / BL78) TaxID=667015 RepID=F0R4F3_PHOSB|nr:hypothetical protein [Phocaeicola salanitronis]ADY37773.1 hypothetical protein Bacsa_3246 [Phocaeicola salanitronis DSM 18170]
MKLLNIEKIGRYAMAIFLITGTCLLTSKGIGLMGMIMLLLLTGEFIGFLFKTLASIIRMLLLSIVILLVA